MSLVEVLVGVTILAFVSLGIMAFLGTTIKQNQTSLDRSYATAIASERIQLITAMPYQSAANFASYKLPEETATAGTPATLTTPVGSIPDYPKFGRSVTLTYDSPVAGMLAVNVTVSWTNIHQNGATKSHTMITYLEPALEQGQ
jgi:type II secretory pathway component PulJ